MTSLPATCSTAAFHAAWSRSRAVLLTRPRRDTRAGAALQPSTFDPVRRVLHAHHDALERSFTVETAATSGKLSSRLTTVLPIDWGRFDDLKALALNEYKDLTFVNAEGTPCSEIAQLNISSGPQACAFVDGQQVLNLLTFDTGSVGECVLYLVIITAVVHTLAYLCLLSKRQKFAPLEPPEASHKLEVGTA